MKVLGRRGGARVASVALAGGLLLVASPASAAHVVAQGETLSQIAQTLRVPMQAIVEANGITDPDRITSGTVLVIPGAAGTAAASSHVVQPGETLSSIAARYGVSVQALAQANGITNPDLIRSGTTLAVSGSGGGGQAPSAPAGSSGRAEDRETNRRLITEAAQRHGWRPAVPLGLAMQESGWNNTVVSSAGAIGLMQVMPATGEWVGTYLLGRPVDLRDPADNAAAGMAYLDYLYDRFNGDVRNTLAAYYEGPRRTEAAGGPSTPGAQRYVDNVLALAERYR